MGALRPFPSHKLSLALEPEILLITYINAAAVELNRQNSILAPA